MLIRPSSVGAFAAGAIGVGGTANFIPSLVTVTMYMIFGNQAALLDLPGAVPGNVLQAWEIIFTVFYGALIGGASAFLGALVAPYARERSYEETSIYNQARASTKNQDNRESEDTA